MEFEINFSLPTSDIFDPCDVSTTTQTTFYFSLPSSVSAKSRVYHRYSDLN